MRHEITWIAALRIIACFLVVLAHCCDPFASGTSSEGFNAGALWGTLCRSSVPLFIMLSGALLLPTTLSVGQFYSRRLKRIILPFIFWSILSPWLFYLLMQFGEHANPTLIPENHTLLATIQASYMWIINFSYSTVPYWYVYMMIGVYLIIPLISDWIAKASKRDLQIVLSIWLFTTIVPYLQAAAPIIGYKGNYESMGLYGECSWNLFTTFHYLGGFLGYAILAHYLVKHPLRWGLKRCIAIGSIVFAAGFTITIWGFHYTRDNFPENFNMLEIIWSFTSLNVLMMTAPIFVIFQKIEFKPRRWISTISQGTYGIFLAHFIFVHVVFEIVFANIDVSPLLQIPIIATLAFALTTIVICLLRKTKLFKKLS